MDVVVDDVLVSYGMLLSRCWGAKLGGTLQLDMTYATIPVFGGQTRRLYQEDKFAYILNDSSNPKNFLVYFENDEMGNYVLSVNIDEYF
jgi:hypothetical protein